MSGHRKRLQEFLHTLDDLPVEVTECRITGSCHYKVYLQHAGAQKFFVCAGSPSDFRCRRNFRSEVAKWIKQIDTHHGDTDAH